MAISSVTNRIAYSGDGSSAVFSFPWRIDASTDLGVIVWNSSRAIISSAKVINTDYTVSGSQDSSGVYKNGCNIIFNSSPSPTDKIVIFRSSAITSTFAIAQGGTIPSTGLTNAIDYLTLLAQRAQDLSIRSMRLPDGYPLTFDPTLPNVLPVNAPLIVNSTGLGFEFGVVANSASVSTSYFGTLPISNGGTGAALNTSAVWGVVFAETAQSFNVTQNGQAGLPFIANSAAMPSFQALDISGSGLPAVVGVLPVTYGGTGTGTSYIQYGVIYASSETQMGTVPSAAAGLVLTSNGSSPPSFQGFSQSSIVQVLQPSVGGTGFYPQGSSNYLVGMNSSGLAMELKNIVADADGNITLPDTKGMTLTGSGAITVKQIASQAIGSSYTVTWPPNQAAGPQVLQNDGTGVLSWQPAGSSMVNPMTAGGDIIYGGTSGVAARLSAGTSGLSVLKSMGPGVAPIWQNESGALINTYVCAGSTIVDVKWPANIQYEVYKIYLSNIVPSGDDQLYIKFWQSSNPVNTPAYSWVRVSMTATTGTPNANGSSGDTNARLHNLTSGSSFKKGACYEFTVNTRYDDSTIGFGTVRFTGNVWASGGQFSDVWGSIAHGTDNYPIEGLRFYWAGTSTFQTGRILVYGFRV